MEDVSYQANVRPMVLTDLAKVFLIDADIRELGQSITYEDLTTKQIFGVEDDENIPADKPSISEAARRVDLGFVAEVNREVCGFILGQSASLGSDTGRFGEITMLGVHPYYQRKGVAEKLVQSLCEDFRARGINTAVAGIVPRDEDLVTFFRAMGFKRGPLMNFIKEL
jgi:ribosomal protein S18 acetylase RimI-like enzyme